MIFKAPPYDIETEYTFYRDFQIADHAKNAGAAVRETYGRVKKEWATNPKAWGEVVCALNWRIWDLHKTDEATARVYNELWEAATDYGYELAEGNPEYMSAFRAKID